MTEKARPWLPDAALTAPGLVTTIDTVIDAWSRRWFGDRTVRQVDMRAWPAAAVHPGLARAWRRLAGGIWLDWTDAAAFALARHALATGENRPKMSPADERLLLVYAERILGELATDLETLLRFRDGGTQPAPGPGMEFKLGSGRDKTTWPLLIESQALVGLAKRLCTAGPSSSAVAATRLSTALGPTAIAIEAMLGSAAMTGLQLRDIAVGDIVVLGRREGEGIVIRARATGSPMAGAKLVQAGDTLHLIAT